MNDPKSQDTWLRWVPVVALLLALLAVAIVFFNLSNKDPLERLTVVVGYVILILLFFFGLVVIFALARGTIDLSLLLSESGGGASMSRFQLLIFTFVIAFSIFLMIVSSKPMRFPNVPAEILTLLGISASTYAVSKGIQASNPGLDKTGKGKTTATKVEKESVEQTTQTNPPGDEP